MRDLKPVHPIGPEFEKELLKDAKTYIYKNSLDGELRIHVFFPEGHQKSDQRSAFLFFHGGLWDKPMVTQFVPQCMHFVSRGAVAATAEYRISKTHRSTPVDSILDAQSMHKVIEHDSYYDSRPNALILYSAIVDTAITNAGVERFPSKKIAKKTSPTRHIRKKLPPAIFFHGREDGVSPIATVEQFATKYRRKKNHCIFSPYSQATHSFFNFNVNRDHYVHTIESADGFISDLGYLLPDDNHYIDPS